MTVNLDDVKKWMRGLEFDITLARTKESRTTKQEFFTPTDYIRDKLDLMDIKIFEDPTIPVLDNMMGSCQILSEVLIKRMEHGLSYEDSIQTLFGLDLSLDNVTVSRRRMSIGNEKYQQICEENFQQADALKIESFTRFKPVTFGQGLFIME
jgi:hypothetical protein